MEIVLVSWTILKGREPAFYAYRRDLDPETPGFLGEVLYRAVDDRDEDAVSFLNVGRWVTRDHFYQALKIEPDAPIPQQEFESKPRRREWFRPD